MVVQNPELEDGVGTESPRGQFLAFRHWLAGFSLITQRRKDAKFIKTKHSVSFPFAIFAALREII
jgi:hypothetical protein